MREYRARNSAKAWLNEYLIDEFTATASGMRLYQSNGEAPIPTTAPEFQEFLRRGEGFAVNMFGIAKGGWSARPETKKRGGVYWCAYRRIGKRVRKIYLPKTFDWSYEAVKQIAFRFAAMESEA